MHIKGESRGRRETEDMKSKIRLKLHARFPLSTKPKYNLEHREWYYVAPTIDSKKTCFREFFNGGRKRGTKFWVICGPWMSFPVHRANSRAPKESDTVKFPLESEEKWTATDQARQVGFNSGDVPTPYTGTAKSHLNVHYVPCFFKKSFSYILNFSI